MKLLIVITLLFTSQGTFAQNEMQDLNLKKQFVSVIKDRANERTLYDSQEFKECREEVSAKTKGKTGDIAEAASTCLAKKIANKTPQQLQDLANSLNLTDYELIQSNNVKEISNYLQNKLYKSLTGTDPSEKLSFRDPKKKMIDQRDLISLYKNQVGKNALLAISNYCFNDLRFKNGSGDHFGDHWSTVFARSSVNFGTSEVNDLGVPQFATDTKDDKDPYGKILESLKIDKSQLSSDTSSESILGKFFMNCLNQVKELCSVFEGNKKSSDGNGAKSCMVKAQLANLRKTLNATDKILSDKEFSDTGKTTLVTGLNGANGSVQGIFDDLTSVSSSDILKGAKTDNSEKTQTCLKSPEDPECEAFLRSSKDTETLLDNTEMNLSFRKEIELQRVKALKELDKAKLDEYLESNGYLNLTSSSSPEEIAAAISARFDGQRVATIKEINDLVGGRQAKSDGKADPTQVEKGAATAASEKVRLAQVVMFNNIITSQLNLQKVNDKGTKENLGRNVNPLKKELADATQNGKVDGDLFKGLQSSVGDTGNSKVTGNENLGSISFIDNILGASDKKSTTKPDGN
jgi:hypothetical protein